MNKSDFIETLDRLLKSLNKEEREKFIYYYEEIIEDYKESGLTEEEVINKIGTPESIAENILSEHDVVKVTSTGSKILITILLVLGFPLWGSLLLAAFLLVLCAYIVIWCGPLITGVSSVALFVASLMSIIGFPFMLFDSLSTGIVQLGVGITSLGLSVLLGFATIYLSEKVIVITKKLTYKVLGLFKRKVVRI